MSGSAIAWTPTPCGRRTTRRLGLACGIVAPILWIGLIAAGDVSRADIDPVVDFISELGERGSATETVIRYAAFILTGALLVVFGASLPFAGPPRERPPQVWKAAIVGAFVILDGIGRAGAGVYPCEPGCEGATDGQTMHYLFAVIGFCSGILAALAAGALYRRRLDAALGAAAAVFLLLMTWGDNPIHAEGLWERLATGTLSVWLLAFAARVMGWPRARNARRS